MDEYLQPTQICDFDQHPAIREKALELTEGCTDDQQRFNRIYHFVKELPYGLEDWDVNASETLQKGWGMCSGKTNLLIAMSRALMIPARYRIFKINGEQRLWKWIAGQDRELAVQFGDPPPEQDHLDCETYLNGWNMYDPSRDSAFENGLKTLGIPLEREPVSDSDGIVHFTVLASVDEWAKKRQQGRRFRRRRQAIFSRANEQMDRIRLLGR